MQDSSLPWWRTDTYGGTHGVPAKWTDYAGPKGIALVRAWPDGRTSPGWGLVSPTSGEGFMPRYMRGEFDPRRALNGYEQDKWGFAFVMRSMRMVCIDIDGKNGGLEHAKRLGMLPPTAAETSKSGTGYHLFYLVEEEWDPEKGFAALSDRIGIQQGVDIRATGCVYHHKQQRWNHRDLVPLPAHLYELLRSREEKIAAQSERIKSVLSSEDELEIMMMHEELLSDLKKPIPTGKRNNTLFAIGCKMRTAEVPEWEQILSDRAQEVGLDAQETSKLVANVERYYATV